MSDCSSISSCSLDSSTDEYDLKPNSSLSYLFSPIKSTTHIPTQSTRSRPGIHRSDHTAASVRQLDLNDSCHSFHSVSTPSTTASQIQQRTQPFQSLYRKESVRHGSFKSDSSFSLNISTHMNDLPSSLGKKSVVQFAPVSETLYIPVPARCDLSIEEIEDTWFTKKDYEEQRESYRSCVKIMEKKLSNTEEGSTNLSDVVKSIDGARGLEHRIKDGAERLFQTRQQSIQAVLREQQKLFKERSYNMDHEGRIEFKSAQFTQQIANVYAFETATAILDARERGIEDAKEAGIIDPDAPTHAPKRRFKASNLSALDRRFAPPTIKDSVPANVTRSNSNELGESLHTLSSSPKQRGTRSRLNPISRQPSMALTNARTRVSNNTISYLPPATSELLQYKASSLRLSNNNNSNNGLARDHLTANKASSLRISSKMVKDSICGGSHHSRTPVRQNNTKGISTRQIIM